MHTDVHSKKKKEIHACAKNFKYKQMTANSWMGTINFIIISFEKQSFFILWPDLEFH